MNAGQLQATLEANKGPILAVAAVGVAGLAYMKKKSAPAADPAADASGYSAGGQTAGMSGGAAYDSSASDLYGAVAPQLESLSGQLTDLRNQLNTRPPVPVPAPPALGQPKPPTPGTRPPVSTTPWVPPSRSVPVPVKTPARATNYGGPQFVTVKSGDTLSKLAAPYASQITPQTVGKLNGIRNLNLIYPGQKLRMY